MEKQEDKQESKEEVELHFNVLKRPDGKYEIGHYIFHESKEKAINACGGNLLTTSVKIKI